MAVRTRDELRRDQQELLEQLRSSGAPVGSFSGSPPSAGPALRIGQVTEVVTSHATYGPHLVVQPQLFSGRPAVASNSTAPTRRVYPAPNRTVGDYAVDDFVALWIARGAELALELHAELIPLP